MERELIAYRGATAPNVAIRPGPRWRDWANEMGNRWANRCLPLLVANEAGWVLLNPLGFEAVWSGESDVSGVTIRFDDGIPTNPPARSHFGYGIITWSVPFLFRTPPGWNLLARGPANWPKDGVAPLEGLVETDWAVATFTMNWKLTRPGHPVRFERDEPFCMVVPQRRHDLESFRPVIRALESDRETHDAVKAWADARRTTHLRKFAGEFVGDEQGVWEGDYFRGTTPDGTSAPEHQTRLKISEFVDETRDGSSPQ